MKAILLAAGIGKRLQPLTDSIPKPMIKIAGKPILEYVLKDLLNSGFNEFCIVVGHKSDQIIDYFSNWNKDDCSFLFVTQNEYKGTAHATYLAKEFVKNDPFLLYLADTIIPIGLNEKLSEMVTNTNTVSILSSECFVNDSNSIGNIIVVNNHVTSISEKSETPKTNLAWAGLAFFRDGSIFKIIENLELSKRGEYDITEAMDYVIKKNQEIINFSCEKFIDCGTPKGLLDGLKFILTKKKLSQQTTQYCNVIDPCYMGNNCTFGTDITIGPFVSLGDNVSIGNNVKINESIVFDNTKIHCNETISHSIISEQVKLSID